MSKYCIQVLVDKGKPSERWAFIKPAHADEPYEYSTWGEANRALQLCYDANPDSYRVKEVDAHDD